MSDHPSPRHSPDLIIPLLLHLGRSATQQLEQSIKEQGAACQRDMQTCGAEYDESLGEARKRHG